MSIKTKGILINVISGISAKSLNVEILTCEYLEDLKISRKCKITRAVGFFCSR
jgi:hypothetical protein